MDNGGGCHAHGQSLCPAAGRLVVNTDADYLAATNQTPDDGLHIARVPLSG
jgi:hypothetical protein